MHIPSRNIIALGFSAVDGVFDVSVIHMVELPLAGRYGRGSFDSSANNGLEP